MTTVARADDRVLLMTDETRRDALTEALRAELAPQGLEVSPLEPPAGSTRLQRAAAAQRAAAERHASAALWIEQDGQGESLRVISATGELPEDARLPRPLAELPPRVFAVVASALLAEVEQSPSSETVPPPPPPPGTAVDRAPPDGAPPDGALDDPEPGSTRSAPDAAPLPGTAPPADRVPLPPGFRPAPAPPGQQPYPPPGAYPPPPPGQAPPHSTHPGHAPYPYGTPQYGTPQAYDPERPPPHELEARRAEKERKRAERRKRRGPRMPRDEWHWRIGGVATATPRVDEFGWQPYQAQDGYALRVTFGRLVATRLRLDLVGAIGGVPGFGPFGNLGGQIQFTTAAWAFRFATGLSATAMIAADRFEDDEFGWVGVELFFPLELGWELNENFGIDFAIGLTMTKPGDEDFWPGGMFVLELEIAQ